jgi:hypothetical protein
MNKIFVRTFLYGLAVLVLMVNATGAAASTVDFLKQSGKVFTVYPTGMDDTANIQNAFAMAKAAGPESTVQLTKGNFRINLIEVQDFKGYFKGAGQDKTVIDMFANQNCQPLIDNNQFPALIYFMRGYPRISDLSFHITPYTPCLPYQMASYGPDWRGTFIFALIVSTSPWNRETDCNELRTEKVSVTIERITIEGEEGARPINENDPKFPPTGKFPNIFEGAYLGGTMALENVWGSGCYQNKYAQGDFRVVQSTFRQAAIGLTVPFLANSHVVIGGSPKESNTFDNMWYIGFLHDDASDSRYEFSFNHMDHIYQYAIYLVQGGMAEKPSIQHPSTFTYSNNDITVQGYGGDFCSGQGFFLLDIDNLGAPFTNYLSTGSRANVILKNNKMDLLPGVCGVILEGLDIPLILNNKIKGSGDLAVVAGTFGSTRRGLIKGNNLNEFSPNSGPYKIVLDWGTENYVVVGESDELVQDLGTNNLIIGKSKHNHNLFGQAIQDAMKQKAELFKHLGRGKNLPAP